MLGALRALGVLGALRALGVQRARALSPHCLSHARKLQQAQSAVQHGALDSLTAVSSELVNPVFRSVQFLTNFWRYRRY